MAACYGRGIAFRLKWFLNDGAPQPKIVGEVCHFVGMILVVVYLGHDLGGSIRRGVAVFFFLPSPKQFLGEREVFKLPKLRNLKEKRSAPLSS